MSIWNCKNLSSLLCLDQAVKLNSLSLGRTALEPDSVLSNAPTFIVMELLEGQTLRHNLLIVGCGRLSVLPEVCSNDVRVTGLSPNDINGQH
jgi:hypothetical protein